MDTSPNSHILRVEFEHRVDLNYRIDLPSQTIRTLLTWPGPAEVNLAELRKYDQVSSGFRVECCVVLRIGPQLRAATQGRRAFDDFKEANITHLPYVPDVLFFRDTFLTAAGFRTYRFAPGLVTDQLGYDIRRVLKVATDQSS